MPTNSLPSAPPALHPTWRGNPPADAAARADLAACRAALRNGSRTFLAASLLLPLAVREPACALYAFCRLADDAVDGPALRSGATAVADTAADVGADAHDSTCVNAGPGTGADANAHAGADAQLEAHAVAGAGANVHAVAGARAVARLRQRLALAYRGTPLPIAADRALAGVVARFAIPRALPEALLEGFEWDAEGRRFETLDDVCDYAARVAGAVGAMMALLMGARTPAALARACELGVAMQLSNIARDVGEDARMGRLYLPRDWLRESGIDPDAWLARPEFNPALASVVERLLVVADAMYGRAAGGVARLPWTCRPGIHAARLLYADIGHEVARRGFDSVSQRAVVSRARRARLLLRAVLPWHSQVDAVRRPASSSMPPPAPLTSTRFLVDAVAATPLRTVARRPAWWHVGKRAEWLIALFERLEQRDRLGLQRRPG